VLVKRSGKRSRKRVKRSGKISMRRKTVYCRVKGRRESAKTCLSCLYSLKEYYGGGVYCRGMWVK